MFGAENAEAQQNAAYPIPELGNCGSKAECKAFCDKAENQQTCINFAEHQGMFKKEEAKKMRDDLSKFKKQVRELGDSPGRCITPAECDAYCRIETHLKECLDYGVRIGNMGQAEADKLLEKAGRGGPGGCKSNVECRNYCMDPAREDECLSFATQEGDLSATEAEFLKKAKEIEKRARKDPAEEGLNKEKAKEVLAKEAGPGGCRNTEECGAYCTEFTHMEECMQFAIKNNLATPQMLQFIKRNMEAGPAPGGCKTKTECEVYCDNSEHSDECMGYMQKQGLVTGEEAQVLRQQRAIYERMDTKGYPGPGGCKDETACNEYCSDFSRIDECLRFAAETGKLNSDLVKRMMGQSPEAKQKYEQMQLEQAKFSEGGEEFGPPSGEDSIFGPPAGFDKYGPPSGAGGMFGPPEGWQGGPPAGMNQYGPPGRGTGQYGPPEGFNMPGTFNPESRPETQGTPQGSIIQNFLGNVQSAFVPFIRILLLLTNR